jgi:hypothetical protein
MTVIDWISAPVGIDAPRWVTRTGCRTVLVVAHTMVSCQRLLDVAEYVESDPRVQVVFTVAPDAFGREVPDFLSRLDALVMPWDQAVRERFDLAVAAAHNGAHLLHAPLMVMAHGAGRGKLTWTGGHGGPTLTDPPVYGLDAPRLTRDGRVIAAALLLAHERERDILRRQCPDALAVASVVGDPCLDRLVGSLQWRPRYRHAIRVSNHQKLVVVSSTWGADGLFGHVPDLLPRLLDQLPADRFRVAALLHPAVWAAHGRRQIRAWLRDCLDAGLILVEPGVDWRSLLIAADYVVGDHGSVTTYAAAVGRPIVHLAARTGVIAPGSAQDLVIGRAARLDLDRPIPPQLRAARPIGGRAVRAKLTSKPGLADRLIRRRMYDLLRLPEPGRHRRSLPVPVPCPAEAAR